MSLTWKDIAQNIAKDAPLLSTVLAATGVGAPVAAAVAATGTLISSALGVPAVPDDVQQALVTNPDAAVKLRTLEDAHGERMQELANAGEAQVFNAQNQQLNTVNTTMQVEDKTREFSWRDFWGYVSGVAFGFVVLVVGYLVEEGVRTNHPENLTQIPAIVGAFSVLFGIAATVLGVQTSIEAHHSGMADRIKAGQ